MIDNTFNGFALDDLTQAGTRMIVNMYGTKDILSDIKINGAAIGGYRENIAGFTASDRNHSLINIKILGASHFDYTYRTQSKREALSFAYRTQSKREALSFE